jgi:hypothetical protein
LTQITDAGLLVVKDATGRVVWSSGDTKSQRFLQQLLSGSKSASCITSSGAQTVSLTDRSRTFTLAINQASKVVFATATSRPVVFHQGAYAASSTPKLCLQADGNVAVGKSGSPWYAQPKIASGSLLRAPYSLSISPTAMAVYDDMCAVAWSLDFQKALQMGKATAGIKPTATECASGTPLNQWSQCGGRSCAGYMRASNRSGECFDAPYTAFCCPSDNTCVRKDEW